jgi:hypothetical protein
MPEVGGIDLRECLLIDPPEALRVEGGYDCRLLLVDVELLILAPLHHRICYKRLVPLVELGVVRVVTTVAVAVAVVPLVACGHSGLASNRWWLAATTLWFRVVWRSRVVRRWCGGYCVLNRSGSSQRAGNRREFEASHLRRCLRVENRRVR